MGKITKVNIAAARAQRDILKRRGKSVPEKIEMLAELDPDLLPPAPEAPQSKVHSGSTTTSAMEPTRVVATGGLDQKWLSQPFTSAVIGLHAANVFPDNDAWATLDAQNAASFLVVHHDNIGEADEFIHRFQERLESGPKGDIPSDR